MGSALGDNEPCLTPSSGPTRDADVDQVGAPFSRPPAPWLLATFSHLIIPEGPREGDRVA